MRGGSLNYLCYKSPEELFHCIAEMEEVEAELITRNAADIAKDVRRLIEYIKTAEKRIGVLSEQLINVFHAVEWWKSGDIRDASVLKALENYRMNKTADFERGEIDHD